MHIWLSDLIKGALRNVARTVDDSVVQPLEKIGENLTPNMRALRLVMTLAEKLLSMGVAASDVVHMCLGITNTYCKRRVHIDISYTQINISQDRGIDREPLTLIRTITPDDANYQQIQALQTLALDIRDKHIPLEKAEAKMDEIVTNPPQQSRWIVYAAGGAVSAGVVLLYDGTPIIIATSFVMGFLVTGMLRWMARIGVATFYAQIITSLVITLSAAALAWSNTYIGFSVNPTILVIGGIVLLVAGMMIVGAFQDAIDEYYVTANARLLKVAMATGGIVVGVLTGLYVATRFGITFPATPDRLSLADTQLQYVGALVIAAAFALRNHAHIWGTIVAGGVGALGWWVSRLALSFDFGVVVACAIAATVVGLVATFVSRFWKIPSLAIIAAGVVPLVPGLSLYNGLMGTIAHPPGDPGFMVALGVLAQAVMIGLGVAAGATLGNIVGRPLRRRMIHLYNHLPRRKLSH
jgi:uncharacterized membrane protein YjjP (DUF1212 family)